MKIELKAHRPVDSIIDRRLNAWKAMKAIVEENVRLSPENKEDLATRGYSERTIGVLDQLLVQITIDEQYKLDNLYQINLAMNLGVDYALAYQYEPGDIITRHGQSHKEPLGSRETIFVLWGIHSQTLMAGDAGRAIAALAAIAKAKGCSVTETIQNHLPVLDKLRQECPGVVNPSTEMGFVGVNDGNPIGILDYSLFKMGYRWNKKTERYVYMGVPDYRLTQRKNNNRR